jgi:hypothetical protein
MNRHWTVDELTDRLYGIREADEHLESCRECSQRFQELHRRRAAVAAAPEVLPAQLAAQRGAVLDRVARRPFGAHSPRMPRWVPALTAAVCLLAVAVFERWPVQIGPRHADTGTAAGVAANGVTTPGVTTTDAQLFSEIYNVEESSEPRAAAPMHALFQEGRQ